MYESGKIKTLQKSYLTISTIFLQHFMQFIYPTIMQLKLASIPMYQKFSALIANIII